MATAASNTISFTISDVTNHETTHTSKSFKIETQVSSGDTIDSYQLDALTVASTTSTISGFTITPTSFFTGVQNIYSFQFVISESILINSYIEITFPSAITIPDTSYSAGTCETVFGLSGGITCEFTSSQVLKLTNGFTTGDFISGTLQFTIDGIQNSRSLEPTASFQTAIYDTSGNGQYAITTGRTLTMTTASDFLSISLSTSSLNNGAVNDYTFSATLSNILKAGEFIRLTFPSEISVTSPT